MRFVLDLIYLAISPFILLYLLVPSRFFTRRRYRAGLWQKFGGVASSDADGPRLLVHAVSVGEARTALPLIKEICRRYPEWQVILSTSTDTGFDAARKGLSETPGVRIIYYPFDFSWAVRRTLAALRPSVVVLVELELWPNFLLECKRRNTQVLVANGRLTERSASRYRRLGAVGRFLFSLPDAFAVQNSSYSDRFRSLQVPSERITVVGNLKYDAASGEEPSATSTRDRLGWNSSAVIMGGCTHPGEESVLLGAVAALDGREANIVLAPRHIERAGAVVQEAERWGLGSVGLWSDVAQRSGDESAVSVLVVDVIGELDRFYRLADVVFVGGTLIPHGGHNMLEPARLGAAVVFGQSCHNFEEIASHLLDRQAALQVEDGPALGQAISELLGDRSGRRELGKRALAASAELGGALDRHMVWLQDVLVSHR